MSNAAAQVVLAFASRGLEESAKLAGRVEKVLEGAKADLDRVSSSPGALADGADEDPRTRREQAAKRLEKRGKRHRRRQRNALAGFSAGRGGVNFGELDESLIQFAEGGGALRAGSLATKGLAQVAGFAAGGVVGGLIVGVAETVIEEFVRPILRERLEALERARIDPIVARLDELEARSFQRRLQEDDQLQQRISRAEIERNNNLASGAWVRDRGPLGRLD